MALKKNSRKKKFEDESQKLKHELLNSFSLSGLMTILLNRVFEVHYILIALLFRAVTPEVFSNLVLLGKIILQCDMNMPHPSAQSTQGHARTEGRA